MKNKAAIDATTKPSAISFRESKRKGDTRHAAVHPVETITNRAREAKRKANTINIQRPLVIITPS